MTRESTETEMNAKRRTLPQFRVHQSILARLHAVGIFGDEESIALDILEWDGMDAMFEWLDAHIGNAHWRAGMHPHIHGHYENGVMIIEHSWGY